MKAKEQVQATYLNKVKVYLKMFENAAIQINKLWMDDHLSAIDLNDFLARMFPFDKSFDELVQDIHLWVEDYEKQIKDYDVLRPFVVEAQRICDLADLNFNDFDCLEEITEPYHCMARNKDEALDQFHDNIPIKVLDDFDITVREDER